MHAVARARVTTGVALLGAGVIALSPIVGTSTDAHIASVRAMSSAAVRLTASVDPVQRWLEVIQTSAANLDGISQQIFDAPAPILEKIATNQLANVQYLAAKGQEMLQNLQLSLESVPAQLRQAGQDLRDGNIVDAVDAFNGAILPPILTVVFYLPDLYKVVANTGQNFANVIAAVPDALFNSALTLAYPLVSGVNATAEILQSVLDAAKAGDINGVVNAVVNAPANLVDGVLNGAGKILGAFPTPGLLTPYDPNMDFLGSGPIAQFLHARQVIADALKPVVVPPTAAVAASKVDTASSIVTLDVPATATTGSGRSTPAVESTNNVGSVTTTTGSETSKTTHTASPSRSSAREGAASSHSKPSGRADSGSKGTGGSARHSASKAS